MQVGDGCTPCSLLDGWGCWRCGVDAHVEESDGGLGCEGEILRQGDW